MVAPFGYLFLLLISTQLTVQISLPSDPTYKAGVVEFAPALTGTFKEKLKDNVRRIIDIIQSTNVSDLDILVFPEHVINGYERRTFVPEGSLLIAPCDVPDYDYSLVEISCAARSRRLYVVINLWEKDYCLDARNVCDEAGLTTYNTNVVFDRQGRVISRYRKSHLYGNEWYSVSVMPQPEHAIFTTDFGVTFGHFICFDMLFYDPAIEIIRKYNISDIIYPTYWFSELPFLTAVQLQEGWSYANNVNLLAADGSVPAEQNTGSGIYAGELGRLAGVVHEEPTTTLLVADVPKRGFKYEMPSIVKPAFTPQLETPRATKISLLRDYNLDIMNTYLLPANFTSVSHRLCHHEFCCSFDIERRLITESNAHTAYHYRTVAFSGLGTFQRKDQSDQSICAIVACTNKELYTCGRIFPESILVGNKYYFNSISITGSFRESKTRLIMPSTVDGQIMPLPSDSWTMKSVSNANKTDVTMELKYPSSNLLTFGIWANYYLPPNNTHNLDPVPKIPNQRNGSSMLKTLGLKDLIFLQVSFLVAFFMPKHLFF